MGTTDNVFVLHGLIEHLLSNYFYLNNKKNVNILCRFYKSVQLFDDRKHFLQINTIYG